MDCDRCFLTVSFTMPAAVVLSQWMGIGGWGCPSPAKVSRSMRASFTLRNIAPSYTSAAYDVTNLRMVHIV